MAIPPNAKLSGKMQLAKMCEARAQPTVIFPFERLVMAGCDDHKQRHLYKVSRQPNRRNKKLPRSATHQTMNFEPLKKRDFTTKLMLAKNCLVKSYNSVIGYIITKTKKRQLVRYSL